MKKTFILGLMAAALGFTACSSEDDAVLGEKTQKKGMVLNATVEQPAETRATIDNSNPESWQFAFAEGDEVKVRPTNHTLGSFYTFKKGTTNFTSEDAEASASPDTWCAFYPSESIDLTNQNGKLTGPGNSVANLFAMAGATASTTTGASGLSIAMQPKVAIIKIDNQKGSIDIRVKYDNEKYIDYLEASSDDASFILNITETPKSVLTATTTGTYYIVVPAGSGYGLSIYDGDELVKSTSGLTAGLYYELTIGDPNLLPGDFSVSATKKVKFTKSNLYWNGSEFKFEADQTDYPTTWNASHVGHFYWTVTKEASYAETYDGSTAEDSDVPFFAQSNGLTVEGTSGLYALSSSEWVYLIANRSSALYNYNVKVGSTEHCLIIAPDDFSGTLASNYTLEEVNLLGLLCLPPAGGRNNTSSISDTATSGYYTSATSSTASYAYQVKFSSSNVFSDGNENRSFARCLRLVK